MIAIKSALIFLFTGNVAAIIVSLPHENYVLEGNRGTIRCQNRSDDERIFYSYITNAVWYRDYGNGTQKQVGSSGPVYSSRHVLYFVPTVRKVDEGIYYCCIPNGPCGNSSKRNTAVRISIPPVISAAKHTYTSVTGSNVILRCYIINKGIPQAVFSWKKNGNTMNGEYSVSINTSRSIMEITLTNLTLDNAGVYICNANALLSHDADRVKLIIAESNVTYKEIKTQVLAVNLVSPCNITKTVYFDAALQNYIQKICNCTNFEINANLLSCIDSNRALYTIKLIGPTVDDILQLWSDYEIYNFQGIDLGVATILLCNNTCFIHDQESSKSNITTAPTSLIIIFTLLCIITHSFDSSSCLFDKKCAERQNQRLKNCWEFKTSFPSQLNTHTQQQEATV